MELDFALLSPTEVAMALFPSDKFGACVDLELAVAASVVPSIANFSLVSSSFEALSCQRKGLVVKHIFF
jgi:hypothetical protein